MKKTKPRNNPLPIAARIVRHMPADLRDAVRQAAKWQLTKPAHYTRQTLVRQVKRDGVKLT